MTTEHLLPLAAMKAALTAEQQTLLDDFENVVFDYSRSHAPVQAVTAARERLVAALAATPKEPSQAAPRCPWPDCPHGSECVHATAAPSSEAAPAPATDSTDPIEALAVNMIRFAGLSKHQARDAAVVALTALTEREGEAAPAPVVPADDTECPRCEGSGEVRGMTSHLGPDDYEFVDSCPACAGTGSADLKDAINALPYIEHRGDVLRIVVERRSVLKLIEARAALAAPSADRAAAPSQAPTDLHAAIMNLPCGTPNIPGVNSEIAYKLGHRDARHAAAELVVAAPKAPQEQGHE